jgi:hypothetical protein
MNRAVRAGEVAEMSLALKRCQERLASTNGGGRWEVSRSSTSRCSSCGVRWPMKRRSKRTAVIQVRFERPLKAALKTGQRSSEAGGRPKPTRQSALRPGTHLVREWNGRTYQIEVLDDGFQMDGKRYRSLSRHRPRSAAPSIPARAPRTGWSRSSTRSMPSGRPAPPTSPARSTRAG